MSRQSPDGHAHPEEESLTEIGTHCTHGRQLGLEENYQKAETTVLLARGMSRNVKAFVQECVECQKVTPMTKAKAPLIPSTSDSTPFDRIVVDVVGPLDLPTTEGVCLF